MRDFGKVYSTFWTSATTRGLSDQGKLLALYLLTGPHTNLIGCFRLPDGYVTEDLEWTDGTVSKGFGELFRKGFATRDKATNTAFVHAFLQWNPIENPNVGKAACRLFELLPDDCEFKHELAKKLSQFGSKVEQRVLEPFLNRFETVSKPVAVAVAVAVAGEIDGSEPNPTPKPASRSIPTLEEVRAYCEERENKIDPERFVDHYTANGWKQSNGNLIKDWRACVRTWEKNDFNTRSVPSPPQDHNAAKLAQIKAAREVIQRRENGGTNGG